MVATILGVLDDLTLDVSANISRWNTQITNSEIARDAALVVLDKNIDAAELNLLKANNKLTSNGIEKTNIDNQLVT